MCYFVELIEKIDLIKLGVEAFEKNQSKEKERKKEQKN